MKSVTFTNDAGLALSATLRLPSVGSPVPVVIFVHGLNSSKDSPRNVPIAESLLKHDIASLMIDFTGHGDSEGSVDQATLEQMNDDLSTAIDFVVKNKDLDESRVGIAGSSLGGTIAVIQCSQNHDIQAMVLRAPPSQEVLQYAEHCATPTLILQGESDSLSNETQQLFKYLKGKKKYTVIKAANHLFEGKMPEVISSTVDWFVENLR